MKRVAFLLLALLPLAALARPVLVPPKHLDLQQDLHPWIFSVAIDGDTVVVAAQRDASPGSSERKDGVFLFQRAPDGNWNFVSSPLNDLSGISQVQLNGNVLTATSGSGANRVFERGATGWTETGTVPNGIVFRIDDGSIFLQRDLQQPCSPPYEQYRKVSGSWQLVATIGGQRCGTGFADINNGHAIAVQFRANTSTQQPPAQIFLNSTGSWAPVASIPSPPLDIEPFFWPTLGGDLAYIEAGYLYRNTGGENWAPAPHFVQPEIDLNLDNVSGQLPRMRGNNLLLGAGERDYELPSHNPEDLSSWDTLRIYRPRTSGAVDYFARLNPDFDLMLSAVSEDGRRVVGAGPPHNGGIPPNTQLYVFEIPAAVTFPDLEQDTFESGNFARWTSSSGQFAVGRTTSAGNGTRVLVQSSLDGDSGATLTVADWTDQAIEADIRPLEFAGTGRWFGLVTRRSDAQNYYYVTFRAPNVISLRRIRNGVVTNLQTTTADQSFTPGRSYRVRLESVGDQHVVFLEGIPRVHVKDSALTQGRPGVAGYRTRYEVDNVLVSGATRLVTVLDDEAGKFFATGQTGSTGNWQPVVTADEPGNFVYHMRQTDNSVDARTFSTMPLPAQVVRGRLTPLSFGSTTGTQDPWFGIAARVVDQNNYLYLTLRRSNQLSLRRLVNGSIQVLATVPLTVTTGQMYNMRLDVIGNRVRAFVNGNLYIETTVPDLQTSGRTGLVMYKTSADVWSNIAYQP